MNPLFGMLHNAMLLCNAENTINRLLENGMTIYLKNPDGTQIKLKPGLQLISLEFVQEEELHK